MEPLRWEGNRTETGPSEYNPVCYRVKSRMSSPPKNTASRTLSCPLPRLSLTHSEQRITLASDRSSKSSLFLRHAQGFIAGIG